MVEQDAVTGVAPAAEEAQPAGKERGGSWLLSLTSFGFIVLQSVCTTLMALSGLRLLIGVGALAAASSLKAFAGAFHVDAIRIPMMLISLLCSALNLFLSSRLRCLRARPSSQWRTAAPPAGKVRSENLQIALAVASIALVGLEEVFHIYLNGL